MSDLLTVVHRAERFVVIDKPAGMLSVPGRGPEKRDSVATRVAAMFPDATGPISVHRLDMETSGLIVCALDAEAHRHLSRQFMEQQVEKRYLAVLEGIVEADEGEIALPLLADWPNRPRQTVDLLQGKPARTRYRVLHRDEAAGRTRVEFVPLTGRTHQLRLHAAWAGAAGGLGCPIVGDSLYGRADGSRLLLHACSLRLRDPANGQWMTFESPAPF